MMNNIYYCPGFCHICGVSICSKEQVENIIHEVLICAECQSNITQLLKTMAEAIDIKELEINENNDRG